MTITGVYNSNQERTNTYVNWSREIDSQSGYVKETSLSNLNATINNLTVDTEAIFTIETVENSRTIYTKEKSNIYGVEDPLLDDTAYARDIDTCSFNSLADKLYDGQDSSGSVRGEAVVEPGDAGAVASPGNKIIVASNIEDYSESNIQNFRGYFSQTEPTSPGIYNTNYTIGTSNMPQIENGENVIIHTGFWKSNFETAINTGCYMPSSLGETPSLLERINENTRGSANNGIYTVLTPTASESDIGYERLDNSTLNLVQIETISESEAYPNFRISRSLAENTGLSELIK